MSHPENLLRTVEDCGRDPVSDLDAFTSSMGVERSRIASQALPAWVRRAAYAERINRDALPLLRRLLAALAGEDDMGEVALDARALLYEVDRS